jgi:hypothetical protein
MGAFILSIDLAYKSYANFGFCLLQESRGKVLKVKVISYHDLSLIGVPEARFFAGRVLRYCRDESVSILMLDGSQGWKYPDNGLADRRQCEQVLHTQIKTGVKGEAKPAKSGLFIGFCTDLFYELYQSGRCLLVSGTRIGVPQDKILVAESYPHAAWRQLGLRPLPSKSRCTPEQIAYHTGELRRLAQLPEMKMLTHDELSALVAGLSGVAIACGDESGYLAVGAPPRISPEGYIMEGFIVVPRRRRDVSTLVPIG